MALEFFMKINELCMDMNNQLRELSQSIGCLLRRQGKTLAVAESCTGGLIGHAITEIPGASAFLIASLVVYSPFAKRVFLNITDDLIDRFGVISKETAEAMARNVRSLGASDYSLATTGNLGPSSLEDKETGLVFVTLCSQSKVITKELRLKGDRSYNKEAAALEALKMLNSALQGTESGDFFC